MGQDAAGYGSRRHLSVYESRSTVLDGDPAPPPRKGGGGVEPPQFLVHVYCAQRAGWIKMPLGTMVGLSPDNIVLDEDPAPPPSLAKGTATKFLAMSVVAKRLDGSRCHLVRT